MSLSKGFARFANWTAHAAGKPATFITCCAVVILWAASGPVFGFSETWQLIINTGTTIITFLMVFLIQNTQNRDGAAIQAKLDELIRVSEAQNAFIGIENLSQEEVEVFRKRCEEAAKHPDPRQTARDVLGAAAEAVRGSGKDKESARRESRPTTPRKAASRRG
jgi:low affinity Fe/Cu permease